MGRVYRISYYAGIQTVRLLHRMRRFFMLLFSPLWLIFKRMAAALKRHRGRTLRAKLATFWAYVQQGVRRVRATWREKPLRGVLQALWLPVEAARRYKKVVYGTLTVALIVASVLILQTTFRYWRSISFALALTDAQGETWGYVADEAVLQAGVAMASERLEETGVAVDTALTSSVSLDMTPQANILERTQVCDYMLSRTDVPLQYACGVYVNSVFQGAVVGRNNADRVLNDILEKHRNGQEGVTATFFETVELIDGQYPEMRVTTAQELTEQLTADKVLQVLVSGTIEYEVEVPFTVKRVADASAYEGTERIRVNGEMGRSLVTATVTYLNGEQLSGVITSSKVIKEPVTQIVAYGTKKIDKYYNGGPNATGRFIWPTPSTRYITQYFRAGTGSNRHGGVDIWRRNMTGDDILAADGGTVIVAEDPRGTSYWSYGKYIIIDHGGGYQTLYAHCSELFVKPGEKVLQGQRIAAVGNTGRSTSPHLHFEVRINGRAVNPMRFF